MRRAVLTSIVALAGCGRIGFDSTADGDASISPLADAMDLAITPMPITTAAAAGCPTVVWTGFDFALAWLDNRASPGRLYFSRVAVDGSIVVADTPFGPIDAGGVGCPAAAWTGSVLAIATSVADNDIYLDLVNPLGVVTLETPVATTTAHESSPRMAWNGTRFGIAYTALMGANEYLRFVPVSSAGALLGSAVMVAIDRSAVVLAPRTTGFALVENAVASPYASTYVEIDDAGAPVSFEREVITSGVGVFGTSMTYDSGRYAIAYGLLDHLVISTGDTTMVSNTVQLPTSKPIFTTIVPCVGGFGLAWVQDEGTSGRSAYFVRLDTTGQPMIPIVRIAHDVSEVGLIWTGDRFGAVLAIRGQLSFVSFVL